MTIPKKGLRKIKVDNIDYYWKFTSNYQNKKLEVIIGKIVNPNKRIILSAKYVDLWLVDNLEEFMKNEIQIVTPDLIRKTIIFANENGWELDKKNKVFKVNLENNFFYIN